jgi:hypothetical protein
MAATVRIAIRHDKLHIGINSDPGIRVACNQRHRCDPPSIASAPRTYNSGTWETNGAALFPALSRATIGSELRILLDGQYVMRRDCLLRQCSIAVANQIASAVLAKVPAAVVSYEK